MTDQRVGTRRSRDRKPPTVVMQAYEKLDPATIKLFQKIGSGFMFVGLAPLLASMLGTIEATYWIFSAGVMAIGLVLLWPPAGLWAVAAIPAAIAKLMPSTQDRMRPDRRGGDD